MNGGLKKCEFGGLYPHKDWIRYYINNKGLIFGLYNHYCSYEHRNFEGYKFNGRSVGVWKYYTISKKNTSILTRKNDMFNGVKMDFIDER